MNTLAQTHNKDLVNYAIDGMDNVSDGIYACDLHNELFNTDYFIIGYYQAEQWLINNPGIFAAIEEILADCPTLQRIWDKRLTASNITAIKKELRKLL